MLKAELVEKECVTWDSVTFARHTFTGKLLYEWYIIDGELQQCSAFYNVLHIESVGVYFVLYVMDDHVTGKSDKSYIAAVHSLELARTILGQAATQSQIDLLGYLPEHQLLDATMTLKSALERGELIDRDKVPLSDEELAEYENEPDVDPSMFVVNLSPGQGE